MVEPQKYSPYQANAVELKIRELRKSATWIDDYNRIDCNEMANDIADHGGFAGVGEDVILPEWAFDDALGRWSRRRHSG